MGGASCFQLLPVARLAPWDTVIDLACYNAAPVIVPIPTRFDPQLASECASIRFHRSAIQRPVCVCCSGSPTLTVRFPPLLLHWCTCTDVLVHRPRRFPFRFPI